MSVRWQKESMLRLFRDSLLLTMLLDSPALIVSGSCFVQIGLIALQLPTVTITAQTSVSHSSNCFPLSVPLAFFWSGRGGRLSQRREDREDREGLSRLQREFCVLSECPKREKDSEPELWSLTESVPPASSRLFLPKSPRNKPTEISHRAGDGSALKRRKWRCLSKVLLKWAARSDLGPCGSLWEKQSILVWTIPPLESTDLGCTRMSHIRISLCSSHQGCERRLLSAAAHIIDEERKKLEAKGAKTLPGIWLSCCCKGRKMKKKNLAQHLKVEKATAV